jgi:hypothetical protein
VLLNESEFKEKKAKFLDFLETTERVDEEVK